MTTALLLVVGIVLFIFAIVSPHRAGKVQRRTNLKAHWLERSANWLWDPLAWWAKKCVEFTRKVIIMVTNWGKKVRKKLPF